MKSNNVRTFIGAYCSDLWSRYYVYASLVVNINGNAEGPTTLFERIYIGYSYTPLGSVIGAAYGFVDFGIAGAIFAWLYNWINKKS